MFASLFRKRGTPPAPPAIPAGKRVYAVGDIHGRDDLFDRLIAMIDADGEARGQRETTIVLLGDLIDRGPASKGVIDRAIRLRDAGRDLRVLKGNHEEVLLSALAGDDNALDLLIRVGGAATLESYGISAADISALDSGSLVWRLASAVPADHVAFLETMEDRIGIGDYLFVHAGIRPGIALDDQRPGDLRWIREPFLDHQAWHGAMIVHGHSISTAPELHDNRLGIDTGAYASGTLTALGLEGTDRWLLQT